MASNYQIKRYNGKFFANVPNDVILGPNQPGSSAVPLNLIGRNKISYGQAQNENFLWLAENFAGELAPVTVPGQLWYNYTTSTGQLLIALKDSARQPDSTDPDSELDWASVPMISNFNTVPDASSSVIGRMVLTNNSDSLRILMKNKEWREIQTIRPHYKQYESLLDINYDTGKNYIAYTANNSSKPVSYFNSGGASQSDSNGYITFIDGDGVLRFGANYFYELKVMARQVSDVSGVVTSSPQIYKTWMVRGSFYVNNKGVITPGVTTVQNIPDPRKIANLTSNIDVIDQGSSTDNWTISVDINNVDPNLTIPSGTTPTAYAQYVTAALNSKVHLGFRVTGSMSGLSVNQTVLTQWSIHARISGVPPIGV